MALYLGDSEKLKINLDYVLCKLNLYTTEIIINGIMLLSSDDFILKDTNGIYLTAKESE